MRHAALLLGEPTDSLLKVLAVYEKAGVLDSMEIWQRARTARNLAAHDYQISYAAVAEHSNNLHELQGMLFEVAGSFVAHSIRTLGIVPASGDFSDFFQKVVAIQQVD